MTLAVALRQLARAGFGRVAVHHGSFPGRPANLVVAQSPRAGALADQGRVVVLTVNRPAAAPTSSTTPEPTSSTTPESSSTSTTGKPPPSTSSSTTTTTTLPGPAA
jgi:beta-lactam-binding protein with PASTA domain